ncbi:phosphonoacetaldehyde hydrolase [Leptolinea tardivitalis]|uniref:phosphonoacetaldehyde hydrolase n=1 Tax=Leptolinea tardivitalis TaxID=229920 RepID=UPI00078348CF|nr:phosphonoacetaldehyde hydrolase [Leptolinea tardivitalis]GAP22146.1 phosphonoacetaldehyde hydrolase [Leptolinea tardivitalis]
MKIQNHRLYKGELRGVILDWAGTTVDYGSFAPTAVFMDLFASRGVPITAAQARAPMGLMKKDHLQAIADNPEVTRDWLLVYGHKPTESEINEMFADFVPRQMHCLEEYAGVIPGVLQAVASFRDLGLKIGSTTGYTREMMDVLVPIARENGYTPDSWVSATDVPAGRPFPWMIYQNAIQLQIYPMEAFVKIGDTVVDIEEGINAGMWTIGLSVTGNLMGLTEKEVKELPDQVFKERRESAAKELYKAGAHYVVDGLADCPLILEEINYRIKQGESPRD